MSDLYKIESTTESGLNWPSEESFNIEEGFEEEIVLMGMEESGIEGSANIADTMLDLYSGFMGWVVDLIPWGMFDAYGMVPHIQNAGDLITAVRYFVPLADLLNCITIIMGVYMIKFTISIINWFIKKVPGLS